MVVDLRHPRRAPLIELHANSNEILGVKQKGSSGETFDYTSLPPNTRVRAQEVAHTIRYVRGKQMEGILEVGNLLVEMRKMLPHGNYLTWVRLELQLEPRTAQNYAAAAEVFYGKSETISHLPITKVYSISRSILSKGVRPRSEPKSRPISKAETTAKDDSALVDLLIRIAGTDVGYLVQLLTVSDYPELASRVEHEEGRRRSNLKVTKPNLGLPLIDLMIAPLDAT